LIRQLFGVKSPENVNAVLCSKLSLKIVSCPDELRARNVK